MNVTIETLRKPIEDELIGFSPNTGSVKPVHIGNGLFRVVMKRTCSTRLLQKFVIETSNGTVPKGHELATVFDILSDENRVDEDIRMEELSLLRGYLKNIVGADKGVYTGTMQSYSAGNEYLVTTDSIGQDGGEFVALWLEKHVPDLFQTIKSRLEDNSDTVTLLSLPLLEKDKQKTYTPTVDPGNVRVLDSDFSANAEDSIQLWNGLVIAAETLAQHMVDHPNKLFVLRANVLFAGFVLLRHLTALEASYVEDNGFTVPPFLLSFASKAIRDPIANASFKTYARACGAVTRFYAWAFGNELEKLDTLSNWCKEQNPPVSQKYQKDASELTSKQQKALDEAREIWNLATKRASSEENGFTILGDAIFQMMITQSGSRNPLAYMKGLGSGIGLVYPPNQSTQRFVVHQDLLEVLVRGVVSPSESIDMPTLQERLWSRYRVVVGGRPEDEARLVDAGIYRVDSDALRNNRQAFAISLGHLDFAQLLADGVLKVGIV